VAVDLPPFLAACRREPTPHTPVWILRQAGRYLPEYRALRARHDFLTVMRTPELAAEVTLQPIRRFGPDGLDAAIVFADIMTPFDGLGLGLRFAPGPVLERPVRAIADLPLDEPPPYVAAAITALRAELPARVPLIGFAGAPFTVFCYLAQGASVEGFPAALALLRSQPKPAGALLDRLAEITLRYLTAQARAGAQALMLFDTAADLLSLDEYERIGLRAARDVLAALAPLGLPRIYFPRSAKLLALAATLPVEVLGIDATTPISRARDVVGDAIALQGNLDPGSLLLPNNLLDARIDEVLREAGDRPGHVFNLGAGIDPATDPDNVARLIERVHRSTVRSA
jgi:uroporphyrinogen decarboxylase